MKSSLRNYQSENNLPVLNIFLMRHGEVDLDFKGKFVGQVDIPLTDKGRDQALWWSEALKDVGLKSIYCSDLIRSHESAKIFVGQAEMPIVRLSQLREIHLGRWEGRSIADVKEAWPVEWEERGRNIVMFRPPDGESFHDLAQRVIPAFQNIVANITGHVLIVGHAGVNRVILCHVMGIELSKLLTIRQDYGHMNVLEFENGDLSVKSLNVGSM